MSVRIGPRNDEGYPFIYAHAQNLKGEESKYDLFNRRGWLDIGWRRPRLLDFSWQAVVKKNPKSWQFGWGFETETYSEHDYGMTFHSGPLSIYTSWTSSKLPKPKPTEWELVFGFSDMAVFDIDIHYQLGYHGWSSATGRIPHNRRREGVIWVFDVLFGRFNYTTRVLDEFELEVPLPERTYHVKATVTEGIRKRPRWPWPNREKHVRIDSSMDPLPHPGNSESDFWDGEDAIFGTGTKVGPKSAIAADITKHVLGLRERYAHDVNWRPTKDWRPKVEA